MPDKNAEDNASKKDEAIEDPVKVGKKAIEANKQINDNDKTTEQKNEDEKKDAEQWRNEG